MNDSPIRDVSDTAFMIASYRALESERADALFRDPAARILAGEHGRQIIESMAGAGPRGGANTLWTRVMAWTVAMRTLIIDEFILSAIAQGTDAVVNLGAGLDTRPYRMALPASLHWVEVDFDHVIQFKQERLAGERPRCRLERVQMDLTDRGARGQLFAQLSARFQQILVLTEGVVVYLTPQDAAQLADDLRAQNSFRRWIVDYFPPAILHRRRFAPMRRQMRNAPFQFIPEDYFGFFHQHGWSPQQVRYLWDEGRRLGRPFPLPLGRFAATVRGLLLSREQQRQFTGYVLFEPARRTNRPAGSASGI